MAQFDHPGSDTRTPTAGKSRAGSDPLVAANPGRRIFLKNGTLILAAAASAMRPAVADDSRVLTTFGLVTDLHYADKPSAGTRYYRETPGKLHEAAIQFRRSQVDFVVELGDLIDAADDVAVEQQYLRTIDREFAAISRDRHYVLGNHCVETLTKPEFLDTVGQSKSWYSFDRGGVHCVVLDACFRQDGQPYGRKNSSWDDANIPPEQLEWLKADLKATAADTLVFVHQRLDVATRHGVRNAAAVRAILESNPGIRAVFQGHSHQNDVTEIAGIPYCTLVAMVEGSGEASSGYSVVTVESGGTIRITGFRRQQSRQWPRRPRTA